MPSKSPNHANKRHDVKAIYRLRKTIADPKKTSNFYARKLRQPNFSVTEEGIVENRAVS